MNLVLFFQTSKTTRVHKQISDDDNVGCNDNYDGNFYRTQVNLGSDLWVRMSVSDSERFVKLN